MQFYLVQQPPYYFTYLPKKFTALPRFSKKKFLIEPARTAATIPNAIEYGIAWAGRTLADNQPNSAENNPSCQPRQLYIAVLMAVILTLALVLIYGLLSDKFVTLTASHQNSFSSQITAILPSSTTKAVDNERIYQKIATQKVLKLAVVAPTPPQTVEKTNGNIDPRFVQAYGEALAQYFANNLGVMLDVVTYSNSTQAQNAIVTGQADMVMLPSPTVPQSDLVKTSYTVAESVVTNPMLVSVSIACQANLGIQPSLIWQIKQSSDKFANRVQEFLCDNKAQHDHLWQFYTQNNLQYMFNQQHFAEAVNVRLPHLQPIFEQTAQRYHQDWKMLAAVAYQESHLQSNAVSPTGVRGIMMLTTDTAKAMGVNSRIDPIQSIQGGAKYLDQLQSQFADVPETDRLWFTLAAYNMGPVAISNIQTNLRQSGKDATSWAEVYHYMMLNKKYTPRYIQCMDYVSNIHGYLTLLNLDSLSPTKIMPDQPINQLT